MSDDENPTTGGQPQQNDADFDANNSIIDKVKSRVSSIFPQTLSKWFSPTTTSTDENNRNGSLRRRREEQIDNDEKRHQQQNSDDSESDGGGSGSRSDADLIIMPPAKKSRLNFNDDYPMVPPNRNLFASTPMIGGNRRKNIEYIKNNEIPYNFTGATTSTFISGDARGIHGSPYIDDDGEVLGVITDGRDWPNKKNISSRRSLNIPITSSSQSPSSQYKKSKIYHNVQINEVTEQSNNLDNEDDEDLVEDNLEDDDDDEIRKAQKYNITNGLRQSINISGGILNNSTGRISRSGGGIGIGDSASESGESQCSSLIRQRNNIDKQKPGLFYQNLGTTTISQSGSSKRTGSMTNDLNFYSHLEGKKSLFSEKNMNSILNNSTLSLTSLNRRQKFNASLYGSTSALSDSRLLNTISPFYKGRTTYGGASAYNKYAQLSQQQKQRQLRVTPTLMRPTSSLSSSSNNSILHENNNNQNITNKNNLNNTTVISSTAKRILDLMDQFTTPLNEVKKMASGIKSPISSSPANKKRFSEADLIASRGIRLSKPLTPYSRPISLSHQTPTLNQLLPPTSELHVPSMAQLVQLKRLQNNNEKLREIANSSKSILNQCEDYKLPNDININNNNNNYEKINSNNISDNNAGKYINKIKNKVTTTRQSNKTIIQQNEQQISDIHLPNVQLPFMKSVPKIDIQITPSLSTTPITTSVTISPQFSNSISRTDVIFNKGNQILTDITKYNVSSRKPINHKELINTNSLNGDIDEFIFSSPIKINDNQLNNKNINIEPINNFKFSPPVAVDSIKNGSGNNDIIFNQNKSTSSIIIGNKIDNSSNSLLQSTSTTIPQLKTGSVLDALKKSNTSIISTTTTTTSIASGFGDKFKMSSNKWECSVCMIRNDETKDKCIACETPRASPTLAVKSTLSQLTASNQIMSNTFGNTFKPSFDTWECDTCMVRNKNDVTQCIACSTQKPGSIKSVPSALSTIPSAAITIKPLDTGFKNIVAQQIGSKWECSACMTRNDLNRTKCICCEQSKPDSNTESSSKFSFGAAAASVPATSQFKFGFGADKSAPKEEDLKNKITPTETTSTKKTDEKSTTGGFVFSGQNSAKDFAPSTKASTGFTFGFKTTATTGESTTPVIPSNTVAVSSGGLKFDVPLTTTASESKTVTPKKSLDNISNNKQLAVTTTVSTVNSFGSVPAAGGFKFSFGVPSTSGLKSTENSPISSQKLSIENKTDSKLTTGSAFKPVGDFTFGTITTSASTEPLKGFVFGGTTTTASAATTTTVSTIVKKDESLKLFAGFATPTNKISEPAKATIPSIQQSTFSSPSFTFGDPIKNVAVTNNATPATTTASPSVFGSGNTSSNLVFGMPAATSTTTPIFGASITAPSANVQSATNTTSSVPTFGNLKSTISVPGASNQQPKPSLFGSSSSNLGSTTFGSNNNQSLIVPQTQAATSSIFGSTFSASNLKSPSSLKSQIPAVTSTTTITNQQPASNVFNFGGADMKNETSKMQPPSLFGSASTSATPLAPNSAFVFGAPKPTESTQQTTSIFGSGAPANNNAAFGSTTFGSSSSSNINSAFGQSQQPNVNPFGSNNTSTNTQQLQNTGFGAPAATPTFGSTSNTSFGSAPVQQQQPFGSTNTSLSFGGFGNTNNNNRITSDSTDCSAAKKPAESGFNFGSVTQNQNTGFSFGSNNNTTKAAFNFSAPAQTPTPSFNFTGSADANSSQPFQFGAPSNTANMQMPLFNSFVGNESTPNAPFQFNAANNIFAPTPTPGTPSIQQGRRKIRTATRRMNPR